MGALLVTGGMGYIGSHFVMHLLENWDNAVDGLVIYDNLSTGNKVVREQFEAIGKGRVKYVWSDLRDEAALERVFLENKIEAVVHFAGLSVVSESMTNPQVYYENNVVGSLNLLNVMNRHGVRKLVFSSTAAVYGEPESVPIKETANQLPTNAYGETKRVVENMLWWHGKAYGLKAVALRYFNAAGAHPSGTLGERHSPETHLIPIVLEVALGKRGEISVFGQDYPTFDGTCVRDYIHVMDLAVAHQLALKYLESGGESAGINLGSENGFSVKQVIETARAVTGCDIPLVMKDKRAGDPAVLIASRGEAALRLGWTPKYSHLKNIVEDAWRFHQNIINY